MFVTGTLGYFNKEIDRWMPPVFRPAPSPCNQPWPV